jgi:alpha-L-fucosidase 2
LWARPGDGEQAVEHPQALLRKSTLPNVWALHPPFQLDGNFGGTAAIGPVAAAEPRWRDRAPPALPRAWSDGRVRGLRARGGVEVDVTWRRGRATAATLRATVAGRHRIVPPPGQSLDGPAELALEAGQSHDLRFR